MIDESRAIEEPSPPLGDLAAAAEHRRDVALTAAGRVEHRTDAIRFGLVRTEFRCRVGEAALVVFHPRGAIAGGQVVLPCAVLFGEAIRDDVEP